MGVGGVCVWTHGRASFHQTTLVGAKAARLPPALRGDLGDRAACGLAGFSDGEARWCGGRAPAAAAWSGLAMANRVMASPGSNGTRTTTAGWWWSLWSCSRWRSYVMPVLDATAAAAMRGEEGAASAAALGGEEEVAGGVWSARRCPRPPARRGP